MSNDFKTAKMVIKLGNNSLGVIMTRELKQAGIAPGDTVLISVELLDKGDRHERFDQQCDQRDEEES